MTATPHPAYLKALKSNFLSIEDIKALIETAIEPFLPFTYSITQQNTLLTIRWTDGPTYDELDQILRSFETLTARQTPKSFWLTKQGHAVFAQTQAFEAYSDENGITDPPSPDALLIENATAFHLELERQLTPPTYLAAYHYIQNTEMPELHEFPWTTPISEENPFQTLESYPFWSPEFEQKLITVAHSLSYSPHAGCCPTTP